MALLRFPWQRTLGPIGLDLGGDKPRAMQARLGTDAPHAFAEGARPAGETLLDRATAAVDALRSGRFRGRQVVVGLPSTTARMHVVRVPVMEGADAREALAWEASERCGIDRAQIVADSMPTGAPPVTGDSREERIVVAAPQEELLAALHLLVDHGFEPVAAEPRFAAIARALARRTRRDADASIVRAVVHMEDDNSTVLVLRGETVAFCREIAIGGSVLDKAVATRLGVPVADAAALRRARIEACAGIGPAVDAVAEEAAAVATRAALDALAGEVALCLRYFGVTFRGGQPSRLVLTGPHGGEPRLAEILGDTCRAEVAAVGHELPIAAAEQIGASARAGGQMHAVAFASWIAAYGSACRSLKSGVEARAA